MTGGELFDEIIKRKTFTEKDAAEIIKQVLEAVAYCHAHHVVHRDLKPENLLLDDKDGDSIKVIDFGTSQVFDPNNKMDQTYGTAYYIAPEILNRSYDEKCDIWSIGVIMYILLTGRPPFDGKRDEQIIKAVQKGKYPKDFAAYKNLSSHAKDLISKLLKYKYKDRVSAQEALEHSWIQGYAEETTVNRDVIVNSLDNLRNFRAEQKL